MKKILLIALVLFSAAIIITACKKGSSDPFVSFRSRQARLCGSWNVTAYTRNAKDQLARTDTLLPSGTQTGTPCGWHTTRFDTATTIGFIFYPDGRFEARGDTVYNQTEIFTVAGSAGCRDTTFKNTPPVTINVGGTWMWGGSAGSIRKEEKLLLSDYNHLNAEVWEIVELKFKEIKLERTETDSLSGHSNIFDMTLTRTK